MLSPSPRSASGDRRQLSKKQIDLGTPADVNAGHSWGHNGKVKTAPAIEEYASGMIHFMVGCHRKHGTGKVLSRKLWRKYIVQNI